MKDVYIYFAILLISFVIIAFITYLLMRHINKKRILNDINNLNIYRNDLASLPILVELSKVEEIAKSEQLEEKIQDFKDRYQKIKEENFNKINDLIIELDDLATAKDLKVYYDKFSDAELILYQTEYSLDKIMNEIDELSSYEEKYRDIVIKLKTKYRKLQKKFEEDENLFGEYKDVVQIQFENIEKRFIDFDTVMEEKLFNEVVLVVKSLDTMIDHLDVIIKELPDIVLLLNEIIPSRIKDLHKEYDELIEKEVPLGYMNFDENLGLLEKKQNDIRDRARVLNLNDSLFDLKAMLEYLDNFYTDFDLEKEVKTDFDLVNEQFNNKVSVIENNIKEIYNQMDDIKDEYDLKEKDLDIIDNVNLKLASIIKEHKLLMKDTKNLNISYNRHNIKLNELLIRLNNVEQDFDVACKSLGSMYDDEVKAKDELDEMFKLLKNCKSKIRKAHLPIIHDNYFVEVDEAEEALNYVKEALENKPIVIKTLNQRVDTARDLVFKLYSTTNEMVKYAYFVDKLMVYGNKYRFDQDIDKDLNRVEILYFKGNYRDSYELVLKVLEKYNKEIVKDIKKICEN